MPLAKSNFVCALPLAFVAILKNAGQQLSTADVTKREPEDRGKANSVKDRAQHWNMKIAMEQEVEPGTFHYASERDLKRSRVYINSNARAAGSARRIRGEEERDKWASWVPFSRTKKTKKTTNSNGRRQRENSRPGKAAVRVRDMKKNSPGGSEAVDVLPTTMHDNDGTEEKDSGDPKVIRIQLQCELLQNEQDTGKLKTVETDRAHGHVEAVVPGEAFDSAGLLVERQQEKKKENFPGKEDTKDIEETIAEKEINENVKIEMLLEVDSVSSKELIFDKDSEEEKGAKDMVLKQKPKDSTDLGNIEQFSSRPEEKEDSTVQDMDRYSQDASEMVKMSEFVLSIDDEGEETNLIEKSDIRADGQEGKRDLSTTPVNSEQETVEEEMSLEKKIGNQNQATSESTNESETDLPPRNEFDDSEPQFERDQRGRSDEDREDSSTKEISVAETVLQVKQEMTDLEQQEANLVGLTHPKETDRTRKEVEAVTEDEFGAMLESLSPKNGQASHVDSDNNCLDCEVFYVNKDGIDKKEAKTATNRKTDEDNDSEDIKADDTDAGIKKVDGIKDGHIQIKNKNRHGNKDGCAYKGDGSTDHTIDNNKEDDKDVMESDFNKDNYDYNSSNSDVRVNRVVQEDADCHTAEGDVSIELEQENLNDAENPLIWPVEEIEIDTTSSSEEEQVGPEVFKKVGKENFSFWSVLRGSLGRATEKGIQESFSFWSILRESLSRAVTFTDKLGDNDEEATIPHAGMPMIPPVKDEGRADHFGSGGVTLMSLAASTGLAAAAALLVAMLAELGCCWWWRW